MKVLMLLPVNSQPRLIKRVKMMVESGHDVTVAYQIRDYFKKNNIPNNCVKIPLYYIENGNYHKRLVKIVKSIIKLRSIAKDWDVVYSFSFDLLLISTLLKAKKRYYEIGDLRIINSFIYKSINKVLLGKQDRIIVTSQKFAEYLQDEYDLPADNLQVIENKLDKSFFGRNWSRKPRERYDKIRVGIIGLLRYNQVLDFLKAVHATPNRLEVHIYGAGIILEDVCKLVDENKVFYHGEFKYPDDLVSIYENIDISFVVYNSDDLNVRLALPNKLYESIYFKAPLIVSSNTFLADQVNRYGVGFAWDIKELQRLPREIERVFDNREYEKFIRNSEIIDLEEVVDSPVLN